MHTDRFAERKQLLERFKRETEEQLAAIRAEDPERFLASVEVCDDLIRRMDSLQDTDALSGEQKAELGNLISEIVELRKEISSLLPPLRSKLEREVQMLNRRKTIEQGYGDAGNYVPSLFFDQRK